MPGVLNRWRACPAGLIGAIVLIVAFEGAVARRPAGLATYGGLGARFAAVAAAREAPSRDVLVLGDSVLKFGVDPRTFSAIAGMRAYNLAVPGTPTMMGEALLRRALASGARPKAVVVGYMTLSGDPRVHLDEFAELFTPADAWRLARDTRDPGMFLDLMARRLLPTLRYRAALRGAVLATLRGNPWESPAPGIPGARASRANLRHWAEHDGAELRDPDAPSEGRMDPERERRLFTQPWRVHPVLARSFRRLCDLALAQGAEVYVVVPSMIPEAQAQRDARGLEAPHTRNLQVVLERTPGAVVLDGRRLGYPSEMFFDACHLNARGAAALSAELARAIALRTPREPGDSRPLWVTLTPEAPSRTAAAPASAAPRRR